MSSGEGLPKKLQRAIRNQRPVESIQAEATIRPRPGLSWGPFNTQCVRRWADAKRSAATQSTPKGSES